MTPPTKRCIRCGEEFPRTVEFFNKNGKYLHPDCKNCRNQSRRQRYQDDPEHAAQCRAQAMRGYWRTIDRVRRWRKRVYAENRELAIARARQWRIDHPEQYRETQRRRKAQHFRAHRQQYNAYTRNYRARKRKAEGAHSAEDVQRQYDAQKGRCYWCGVSLDGAVWHVDHVVPLSRGGSNWPANLVIACQFCNCSRNDRLPDEWKPIIR